jgi:hypothetical protein
MRTPVPVDNVDEAVVKRDLHEHQLANCHVLDIRRERDVDAGVAPEVT